MREKVKISSPCGRVSTFIGAAGGLLTSAAFGITGVGALAVIGGLSAWGYLCGKHARDEEVDILKDVNLRQSINIANSMKRQSRPGERYYLEHSTSKTASSMTPIGSLIFGKDIKVTRNICED